jgi:hypothetical protein
MSATPTPSVPPPAGTTSGNGKYIVLVVLLLGGVGGIIAWKKMQSDPVATGPSASVSVAPPPRPKVDDDIPPPPPPEEKPEAGAPTTVKNTGPANTGCEAKTCSGSSTDDLNAALAARARLARKCYEQALANDAELQGKLSVTVKVGTGGASCAASIKSDDLHSATVSNCVVNYFRNGNFPAPRGGCVEATVPLNFVKR